ncbi:MAG: ABC transporter ATP-binding protein [Candidatus Bathyarchaeia archaeon]|jgi:ABC-type Fe3+/spermidine/putrescine transport system ATPase subunit
MIKLESVSKSFGQKTILKDLTLDVQKSEIFSLLGPNGCGKTTTLNVTSGLSNPDTGKIYIDDTLVYGALGNKMVCLTPCERKIGYVFQTAALFPHMKVKDNVAYGLKAKRLSKQEIAEKTRSLLQFVGMGEYAEHFPHQISGGQKQLVALARSVATDPEVLLLDEPLSAVDVKMRETLRFEFKSLLRKLNITAVYVTHDLTEALVMSSRVAVMGNGRIEQVGNRDDILGKPNSRYVAEFLGLNVFTAKAVQKPKGKTDLDINGVVLMAPNLEVPDGEPVLVTIKPEDVILSSQSSLKEPKSICCRCNFLKGTIVEITLMRSIARVTVDVGFQIRSKLTLSSLGDLGLIEGDTVCVKFKIDALNVSTKNTP